MGKLKKSGANSKAVDARNKKKEAKAEASARCVLVRETSKAIYTEICSCIYRFERESV